MSYANIDEALTALADAIRNKSGYEHPMTVAKMIELVNSLEIGSGSDSGGYSEEIKYGVINSDGKFQEIDISGESIAAVGGAIDIELSMFDFFGYDEPLYADNSASFAVIDENGDMQVLDLTGDEPEAAGEPIAKPSIFIPDTGMNEPEY